MIALDRGGVIDIADFSGPYRKLLERGLITMKTMREKAGEFNVEKVKQEDIVASGGAADEAD